MEKKIAELKVMITKLAAEVSKIKLDAADTRIHLKATMGDLNMLSSQVQNMDKQIEANYQKTEINAKKQEAMEKTSKLSLTELGKLYRKDPVAGRKAAEAQGLDIGTGRGGNPWIFKDVTEQRRICSIDPELANRLKSEAAAHYAASIR